jgi:hypothetical protein
VRFRWAFCLLFLTGCGLTSSPADGLSFGAPYGWQASPGILGYMQYWHPAGGSDQLLMLMKSPFKEVDLSRAPSQTELQQTNIRVHVDSWDKITICGDQPALYIIGESLRNTKSGEEQTHMRTVISNLNGTTYIAAYAYPLTGEPNGEALAALRQLCLKK